MNTEGRAAGALALPRQAYLPGRTERPPDTFFDIPALAIDAPVDAHTVAWRYGLRLFENGFFWEAHEVLEPVWLACLPNSRERHGVQAVIQLSNAALKMRLGKPNATGRLIAIAIDLLKRAGPDAGPLDLDATGCAAALSRIDPNVGETEGRIVDAVLSNLHYNAKSEQRLLG